jgi:uncharacterized membrane protein (DUF106 family)
MSVHGVIFIDIISLGFILLIVNLLRNHRLTQGFALIWLFAIASLMVIVTFPPVMDLVTLAVGAIFPASAISLLAFVFIFLMLIVISMHISIISKRQVDLIQSMAIFELSKKEQEEEKQKEE